MKYRIGTDKILRKVESPLIEGWEVMCTYEQVTKIYQQELEKSRHDRCGWFMMMLEYILDRMSKAAGPLGQEAVTELRWVGAKIPLSQMSRILGTIRKFPHTECGFVLEYRAEDGTWNVEATEQQGVSAYVRWEDTVQHDGFMSMGTTHTHPEMNAFFSGTDHHNDEGMYGVHLVLGLTAGDAVRTACRIYTPYSYCDIPITDICEEFDPHAEYEPVEEWVKLIQHGIDHPAGRQASFRFPWANTDKAPGHSREEWEHMRYEPGFDDLRDYMFNDDEDDDEDDWEDEDLENDAYFELYDMDVSVDLIEDLLNDIEVLNKVCEKLNAFDDVIARMQFVKPEELRSAISDFMDDPEIRVQPRKVRTAIYIAAMQVVAYHAEDLAR